MKTVLLFIGLLPPAVSLGRIIPKHRRRPIQDLALSGETQQEEKLDSDRRHSGNGRGPHRAILMTPPISRVLQRSPVSTASSPAMPPRSAWPLVPVSLYATGLISKGSKMKGTAPLAGEAVADSEILTFLLKDAFKRVPPA
jgi:hypothetical protein